MNIGDKEIHLEIHSQIQNHFKILDVDYGKKYETNCIANFLSLNVKIRCFMQKKMSCFWRQNVNNR